MDNTFSKRINNIRKILKENNLYAYIILSSDPHMSEYLAQHWKFREWVSGFTGSVGTIIITENFSGLWVDGRYWQQAENQLQGSNIELKKIIKSSDSYIEWLKKNIPPNSNVGINGKILSYYEKKLLEKALDNSNLITNYDLADDIWQERPKLPQNKIFELPAKFSINSRLKKITSIRKSLKKINVECVIISSLDDIAWISNLRGQDIDYNPVFLSYMIISLNKAILFVDKQKLDTDLLHKLSNDNIIIKNYDDIKNEILNINKNINVLINSKKISSFLVDLIPNKNNIIDNVLPSTLAKSVKNNGEIKNIKHTMILDGIALCNFFAWLEENINKVKITELTIAEKLYYFRSKQENFVCESFATIAGFNENGALPHYLATSNKYLEIKNNGLLLIDSGGQYLGGTTDITRVIPIGNITKEQKKDFTLVLKANIALSQAIVPNGIKSPLIDSIARYHLWKNCIDYNHGTGHGVGYFLNVHEEPQAISYNRTPTYETALFAGMVTSNEPGIYRKNKWGIRIENLMVSHLVKNNSETEFGEYLYFEILTLCPIDTRLIDKSLLETTEINWINSYHKKVFNKLKNKLPTDTLKWLKMRTKAI